MRVLVTCGEHRAALSVVRSLGHAGHEVHVCSSRCPSMSGASRWARSEHSVPDPVGDPVAYATEVGAILRRAAPEVVVPVTEAALLALLPLAPEHPDILFPFPDLDRFSAICDKSRVFEVAREEGIEVPGEIVLRRPDDPRRERLAELEFPVVIKPSRSVSGTSAGRSRHGVVHAADAVALARELDAIGGDAYPVHIQRRVVGPGTGVFLLTWGGRRIASFAHRRLREKPPSGGVSVYCESVPLDPDLLRRSERLLRRFEWDGVAMVEYKVDRDTGVPYLMEINGRFWGSLELAVSAGVDFPSLLVQAASGADVPVVDRYRTGVRSRWIWGDVDHLITRLRRSDASLSLPPGSPGRLGAFAEFAAAFLRGRPDVWRPSDLAPAIRESVDWFAALGEAGRDA